MRHASLAAILVPVLLSSSVWAVDYDRLDRRLVKEPAYRSETPQYALLLFGKYAPVRVWTVLDGQAVYIDRDADGDLTEPGERFNGLDDCKNIEIAAPDGKTTYVIKGLSEHDGTVDEAAYHNLMVDVSIRGPVSFEQYCDAQLKADPQKASVAHFDGPLTVGPSTINWELPAGLKLRTGEKPVSLPAVVGTMNAKHRCWVVVRSHVGDKSAFPEGVHPTVEVEYPARNPNDPPVRETYPLAGFC